MGCGISKSSVSIISTAHKPPEVNRSAHYKTNRANTPRSDSNKPNPTGHLLNQSLDTSSVYSPRFNQFKSAESSFNHGNSSIVKRGESLRRGESFRSNQVKSLTSLHQTSINNASLHHTSIQNDSIHQTSVHNASLQHTSFHNTSLHQTSFNNNSLLPEIGSDLEESILRETGRKIRLERGHTSITRKSSDSDSSLSPLEGYDSKSYGDGKSIITSRTVLTTQSAVSGRTKSTFLQRSTYDFDFNEHNDVTSPVTSPTEGYHGTQSRLKVLSQVPVRPPVVYGGNHFWWPSKRMLFNDYRHVKELDNAVSQVQLAMGMDAQQLVARLKRHCEEEVDVARAIYRWMSHNISFRPESSPCRKEPTPLQVLRDGKGTAKGQSLLYQYLCSLANLQCEIVEGLCKQVNFFPGVFEADMCTVESPMYHVWIKIRLCRRWYLLDVALSQHGCSRDHDRGTPVFAEELFLPRPSDLIATHFPMQSQGEQLVLDSDNQLLGDSPLMDVKEWAGSVVRTVAANEWGIKALSHQRGVIETDENEVWLQFMCPNIMEYHVCLEAPEAALEHQGYSLIYLQDDIVTAYVRLPGPGVYVVRLYAAPCYVKPGVEGLGCKLVMVYTIHATGAIIHLPFSLTFDGLWSITPHLYDSGCRVLSTKGAEITAVDGRISVDLRLPVDAIIPNLVWFCKAREENINLDGFVYAEREGRLARIHLLCPHPGEYILLFQIPVEDPTCNGNMNNKSAYARFFITCQSPATTSEGAPSFPIFEHCLSGSFESIENYGLWLPEQLGSTLYAEQGCCQFLLRQDRPVRVVHSIEGEAGVIHREASRWIQAERNGYDIIYHLRISEPGRYRVTLSAGEYETTDLEIICVLMVDALVAYFGDLFPECDTIWGVEPSFHELGLCSDLEEQSKIPVKNGLAKLEIRARKDIILLSKLFHANDKSMDMTEHRVVCRKETGLVFYMTLPFKGYYRLKITLNDQVVASYLLSCDVPAKPALAYEPFHTVYGITEAFTSHGLRELKDEHTPIKTTENGECLIRHSAPRGFPVHYCLVRNSQEIKGCVYAERLSSEVVYHIELQKTGYYRFTCWSKFEDGKRDGLLFSYLILCPEDNKDHVTTLGSYPELSEIWGLNTLGFNYGISVRSPQSSTIRAVEGMAAVVLSHSDEVEVSYTLEHPDLTLQEAKRCVFVEHSANTTASTMRHISISLPGIGRYALKLSAKKEGEKDSQAIGAFLVISNDEEPGAHSFPVFSGFYEGCKLGEPKINPLSAGTEYFFQLEIPGARMVQLWDGMGRWRELLQPQDGSDVVSGMVNVGDPKELWVAGMFDPEFSHGNGGFRDLLMYEVI